MVENKFLNAVLEQRGLLVAFTGASLTDCLAAPCSSSRSAIPRLPRYLFHHLLIGSLFPALSRRDAPSRLPLCDVHTMEGKVSFMFSAVLWLLWSLEKCRLGRCDTRAAVFFLLSVFDVRMFFVLAMKGSARRRGTTACSSRATRSCSRRRSAGSSARRARASRRSTWPWETPGSLPTAGASRLTPGWTRTSYRGT